MEKLFAKLSLVVLLGLSVCLVVGIATPYWVSGSDYNSGLWQSCYNANRTAKGERTCDKLEDRADFQGWINGVRVVEIIACIGGFVGVLFLISYNIKNDGQANLDRIKFVLFLCLVSCVLSIIGVILYGSKRNNGYFGRNKDYDWSFVLTTISGCSLFLVIFPLSIEINRARQLGTYESI